MSISVVQETTRLVNKLSKNGQSKEELRNRGGSRIFMSPTYKCHG